MGFSSMKRIKCLMCGLFVAGFFCRAILASGTSIETVKKLHSDLLSNYNKDIRPTKNQNKAIVIHFGFALLEIAYLDKESGSMLINSWIKMSWQDDQLRWNPKDYQGTESIKLPATSIWLPDIRLYNGLESEADLSVKAVIDSAGHASTVIPAKFAVTCRHEFRGNVWSCPFKFASWTYNGFEMDIVPNDGKTDIDVADYMRSDYYAVVSHTGERKLNRYDCCREPYPAMEYLLKLRSKMGPSLLGRRRRK